MMKKLLLSLFVCTFIFSSAVIFAKKHETEKKETAEQKKLTKEERKAERERARQEKRRLEKEQKKAEKTEKKNEKEVQKQSRVEAKKEEKKKHFWNNWTRKEKEQEELKIRASEKEAQAAKKVEQKQERYMNAIEVKKLADEKKKIRCEKIKVEKDLAVVTREKLMLMNKMNERKDVAEDYAQGRYADLYVRPAWPFEMFYADKKDIFQVAMKYDYATDAYNSNGSTMDLAKLNLGEKKFEIEDILLATKLYNKDLVDSSWSDYNAAASMLFNSYSDKKLTFLGESNEFDVSLDFARYVWGRNALLGVRVPFGYQSHKLKLSSNYGPFDEAHLELDDIIDNNVTLPVQTMLEEMFNYAIAPKHLRYLRKSSVIGIGDISTFINFQFKTRYVDRFIVGIDVLWPTAKGPDHHKLWAPCLGSEFTKVDFFAAVLFNFQKTWFNPHMFLKGVYQVKGTKARRVPKVISHTENNYTSDGEGGTTFNAEIGPDVMAHGELIKYIEDVFFKGYLDSNVPALADHVKDVSIRPGPEVELRIGNVFEKFIWRRAFLDLYYNFRAKWRDHIGQSNLCRDNWRPDLLKYETQQIENKVGLDFTYQIDAQSRIQAGFNYIFAGINVPVTLEGTFAVNVEF